MTSRPRHHRRTPQGQQPWLPGLIDALRTREKPSSLRRFFSPGEYALRRASFRLSFVILLLTFLFLVIAGRTALLTFHTETKEPQELKALRADIPVTARANITDRHGTLLATSLPTVMLMADARKILDPSDAASKLASVFPEINADRLAQAITSSRRYVTIRRHVTPRQYAAINRMGIAGLEFAPDESRIYPAGGVTAHVVGYTDIDNNGIAGLEKSLHRQLQNKQDPLMSSLDLRMQTILHREIGDAVHEFRALGGAGVMMDIHTGEILSLVSLPDFDPQKAGKASDAARFNRASLGVYEMGSTFKIFTTALALESPQIRLSDRFDTLHPIEVGGRVIRDMHPATHALNVAEIFTLSSNIGSARMAEKIGVSAQRAFLEKLGLTERPSLEIPEVGAPIVPAGSSWRETTLMTIAFGHGIAVSAVQLASAIASMVNGGTRVEPTLLKLDVATLAKLDRTKEDRRVISAKTSQQLLALMRLVVKFGTGKRADVAGYMVGGKTGTADKIVGRRYAQNARISSFIGVFPAHAPRYLVFVLLDDPKGTPKTHGFATGGWTAAPVVGRIVMQAAPLLWLPPVDRDMIKTTENRLLKPLGAGLLDSLNLEKETDDYASVESNRTQ
ncbi:MAG: penicillin-binding protein 2 [Alphaproteobacteria bacterium]|nr:penicillin-binding protein 2 [Alphaproteobacteria bacterium]